MNGYSSEESLWGSDGLLWRRQLRSSNDHMRPFITPLSIDIPEDLPLDDATFTSRSINYGDDEITPNASWLPYCHLEDSPTPVTRTSANEASMVMCYCEQCCLSCPQCTYILVKPETSLGPDNTECRMCGEEDETMEHLLCECHALARMNDFGNGYPEPKEFKALALSTIIKYMERVIQALE